MSELDRARGEIDAIDKSMAELFTKRMQAAASIAQYKQQNGLPVLDASREQAVIDANTARLQNPALAEFYTDFLRHLLSLSRQYQTQLLGQGTVAYQGAAGGFGHTVAATLYPHARQLPQPTFAEVFSAVEQGHAAFGVVPFENSNTGDVSGVLDLCYAHNCYIAAMFDLPVTQNLLGLPGAKLGDIQKVYSHVQALEQSARFLRGIGAQPLPYDNTASAAQYVAGQGDITLGAIASLESARRYGLVPLATDIATQTNNTTRFLVLSRQRPTSGDRFALLVTVENTVGQLARVIQTISAQGFNMENIKSRPMPKRPWEYYFYIELVGAADAAGSEALLAELEKTCLSARLLGVFQRSTAPPAK